MIPTIVLTLLLAAAILPEGLSCGLNESAFSGREYTNRDYGFSFKVPYGLRACRLKPPAPQHGLTVYPSKNLRGEIQIYAEYDVLMLANAEQLAKHTAKAFSRAYQVTTTSDKSAMLDGLNARDLVLAGDHPGAGVNYIHFILAYSLARDEWELSTPFFCNVPARIPVPSTHFQRLPHLSSFSL